MDFFCWVSSSLYILDISPLSDMWLTNIFSHSVACSFSLFLRSKINQFFFMDYAFHVKSKNSLHSPRSQWYFSVFFSSGCIVLCFTFKSVNYYLYQYKVWHLDRGLFWGFSGLWMHSSSSTICCKENISFIELLFTGVKN